MHFWIAQITYILSESQKSGKLLKRKRKILRHDLTQYALNIYEDHSIVRREKGNRSTLDMFVAIKALSLCLKLELFLVYSFICLVSLH